MEGIDPNVELLADIPISGPEEDLLDRARFAHRLGELAIAGPVRASRIVALTGDPGAGKSSVLRIVTSSLATQSELALIVIDGAMYASAHAVMTGIVNELTRLFTAAGVVETGDKIRSTLASYGGVVSNIARLAGVKVDVAGALEKSTDAMRAEITKDIEQIAKRIVIVVDHLDRLPAAEVVGALEALEMYAAIPYVAIVIAVDRRGLALALARTPGDRLVFDRAVQVELALPPPDRLLLARVMAGGVQRIAARTGRDLDAALALFDPDGGLGIALVETPRDAKRAINAVAAALPLAAPGADVYDTCLAIILRVLVPELDGAKLDAATRAEDRAALYTELAARLAGHRRVTAARAALAALLTG